MNDNKEAENGYLASYQSSLGPCLDKLGSKNCCLRSQLSAPVIKPKTIDDQLIRCLNPSHQYEFCPLYPPRTTGSGLNEPAIRTVKGICSAINLKEPADMVCPYFNCSSHSPPKLIKFFKI